MAKDYLSSKERIQLASFIVQTDVLEDVIDRNRLTKTEISKLKHSRTRLYSALEEIKDRIGQKEMKKIGNIIADNRLEFVSRYKVAAPEKELITQDKIMNLMEMLIHAYCMDCKRNDFLTCHIFEINRDLDIDCELNEPDGLCPYRYMCEEYKANKAVENDQ